MKHKPGSNWPPGDDKWGYKNILKYSLSTTFYLTFQRMYGTIFFEGVYYRKEIPQFTQQVVAAMDRPFEEQLQLFYYMNKQMQGINFQKKPNYIIEDDDNLVEMKH